MSSSVAAPLKTIGILAALLLSTVAAPSQAAPGAFELSATAACFSYSPVIYISWTTSAGATHYDIFRDGQPITLKKDIEPSGSYLYDDAVTGDPPHSYVIRARDAAGLTTDSNVVTIAVTSQCAPGPPAAITISGKAFCIVGDATHSPRPGAYLSWDRVHYASHFDVFRDGVFFFRIQAYSDQILYDFQQLKPAAGGPAFRYSVIAENPLGKSTSNEVVLTIPDDVCITAPPPFAPGPFNVSATPFCNNATPAVHLQWSAASNAGSYTVIRNGVPVSTVLPSATISFDDTAALSDGLFSYYVRATAAGGAAASNIANVSIDSAACAELLPDLAAAEITPSWVSGRAGQAISLSVSVMNRGSAAAPATTGRVRFGRGATMSISDSLLATIALPPVDVGAEVHRNVTVTLPAVAAGAYTLFLSVDEEHVSRDAQVTNNVKASAALTLGDMIPPKRRAATH